MTNFPLFESKTIKIFAGLEHHQKDILYAHREMCIFSKNVFADNEMSLDIMKNKTIIKKSMKTRIATSKISRLFVMYDRNVKNQNDHKNVH